MIITSNPGGYHLFDSFFHTFHGNKNFISFFFFASVLTTCQAKNKMPVIFSWFYGGKLSVRKQDILANFMQILNKIDKFYENEMLLSIWGISRPILWREYCLILDIFDHKSIWHTNSTGINYHITSHFRFTQTKNTHFVIDCTSSEYHYYIGHY